MKEKIKIIQTLLMNNELDIKFIDVTKKSVEKSY